jgi:sirohydrochlorin ferrochelatase
MKNFLSYGHDDNTAMVERIRKDLEALLLYERALAIRENVLGSDHPDTQATRERLQALTQRGTQIKTP